MPRSPKTCHDSFHPFPNLVLELRTLIWTYALSQPCLIKVHLEDILYGEPDGLAIRIPKFVTHSKNPPLLRTCRESRELALKVYETCLSTMGDFTIGFYDISRIPDISQSRRVRRNEFLPKASQKPFGISRSKATPYPHHKSCSTGIIFNPACDTIFFDPARADDNIFSLWILGMSTSMFKTTNIQSIAISKMLATKGIFFKHFMFHTPLDLPLGVLGQLHGSLFGNQTLHDQTDFPLPKLRERILVCEDNEWKPGMDEDAFIESIRIKDGGPKYSILTRSCIEESGRWGGYDEGPSPNLLSISPFTLWPFSFMKKGI